MARKKSEEPVEKANLMDARWINTPFAFARFGKDFSLLQQHVMLIVSDHLQDYLSSFFRDGRHLHPEDPLSLFDKEQMTNGIPDLKIQISEFQIKSNNNYELYKAFTEISQVQLKVPIYQDGVIDHMDWLPVFSKMSVPLTKNTDNEFIDIDYRRGYVEFTINPLVAAYAFNMRLGYINHPLNIAKDSSQQYAPRLYFLVKHKMAKGRRTVTIPYPELRKELGMQLIDKDTHEVKGEMYPQFSKFRTRVLDAAIADIDRMSDLNLIDVKFSYEPVYRGSVERGDPEAVTFNVTLSALGEYHKDPKKAQAHMEITITTDKPQPAKKRGRPRKNTGTTDGPGLFDNLDQPKTSGDQQKEVFIKGDKADLWKELVDEYTGDQKERLKKADYMGTLNGAFYVSFDSYDDYNQLSGAVVSDECLRKLLDKYLPDQFKMNRIKLSTKKA